MRPVLVQLRRQANQAADTAVIYSQTSPFALAIWQWTLPEEYGHRWRW
jgi:hypothetical protein